MRVLHVMAGADAGGAETMMLDGVLALAEAGVEQRVVTRDARARIEAIRAAGVTVDEASFDKFWRFPTQTTINRAIDQFSPDIIHYWMGRAGMFAPAKHRAKSLGWYGGYYKLSRFRNCDWQAGVTKDIARHIVDQGAPADHVSTLHTFAAIDEAPARRARRIRHAGRCAGRARAGAAALEKGASTRCLMRSHSCRACTHGSLAQARWKPNSNIALRASISMTASASWAGGTDRAALLGACDVVAFPSRYEPFGTVTVEAWAAGKPLVVADAAGPAATVTNEIDALLVPKDDVAALRDALKRVLEDAGLAHTLVANGRRAYEAGFTKQAFVRAAMTLYEKIKNATV